MDQPLNEVRALLAQATAAPKCAPCGCLRDAIHRLEESPLAPELELTAAKEVLAPQRYDCAGCATCWPAEALAAAEALGGLAPEPAGPPQPGWPVFPAQLQVHSYSAPVAVCTLHSPGLTLPPTPGLGAVGPLRTENLGIQRLVENVISNPNIRFLVLCGQDSAGRVGHFPGQSLQALVHSGLDERGHIIGARGRRARLDLDPARVQRFRQQITLVDRIGEQDPQALVQLVAELAQRITRALPPFALPQLQLPRRRAHPPGPLVLDPSGYVVVVPDADRGVLVAEHYSNAGQLTQLIEGPRAEAVMATLLEQQLISRLDHAAYLGRELALAELTLLEGRPYHQDRAPEPPAAQPEPPASCCGPKSCC